MLVKTWDAVGLLDRMFDDVMGTTLGTAATSRSFAPDIDVRRTEDEILVVCDVPGLKREDLEVTLQDHVLCIKGSRALEAKENEQVMLGRTYGTFERHFTLSDSLEEDQLSATLADGVLTVRVPRKPKAKPIKIQIGSGGDGTKQLKE